MVKTKGQIALVRNLFLLSILLTVVPDVKSGPNDFLLPRRKHTQLLIMPHNECHHNDNQLFISLLTGKYYRHHPTLYAPSAPLLNTSGFHNFYVSSGTSIPGFLPADHRERGIHPINGPPPRPNRGNSGDQPIKSRATYHHADSCFPAPEVLLASTGKNPIYPDKNSLDIPSYTLPQANQQLKFMRAPELICPDDISTYTDINECSAFMAGDLDPVFDEAAVVRLTWEMDGTVVDASPPQGINLIGDYTFPEGATMITYTATGTDGSTTSCTFTITISDNQVPRLESMPANITVAATPGQCTNTVFWIEPVVSDNCTPPSLIRRESNYRPGDSFPVGTTRVYYTAIDAMHNESQPQSFTVTVEDRQPPVFTLPAGASVECGQPLPAPWTSLQQVTAAGGSATDNCTIGETTFRLLSETKSSTICPYTLTRVYEIADAAGNKTTAQHLIQVNGKETPPLIPAEPEVVVPLKSGMAGTYVSVMDGDWNNPATWSPAGIPGPGDKVTIKATHEITLIADAECDDITIESGGILNTGILTLTVTGNLSNAGIINSPNGKIFISGNWAITGTGIYNGSTNGVVEFTGIGPATISGSTQFEALIINKASDVTLTLSGTVTTSTGGDITLTSGNLFIPTTGSLTYNRIKNLTIAPTAQLVIDGGYLKTTASLHNDGIFRIIKGKAEIGNSSGNGLETISTGTFEMLDGELNIAGRFEVTDGTALISGGTIDLNTVGHTSSTLATLHLTADSKFTMTAGIINFKNPAGINKLDLAILSGGSKSFGGTLNFGTGTSATYRLSSQISFPTYSAAANTEIVLRIPVIQNGTYTFPLSSNGTSIPVDVTVNGSSYTNAYIELSTTDSKHLNNLNSKYLKRFWKITTNGITIPTYTVEAKFLSTDVINNPTNLFAAGYVSSNWIKGAAVSGTTFSIAGSSPSLEFTALEAPTVSITATPAAICLGSSAVLTANAYGDPIQSYSWSPSTGLSNTIIHNPVATPTSTTEYTVIVTDENQLTAESSITITVNPLPVATAGSNSPVCENQTLNLTASGGDSYSWAGPNGYTSASQNPSIPNSTIAAAGTYTVTVTDANGCVAVASTDVIINPLIPVSVSIVASENPICAGTSVTFTATPTNEGSLPLYQWKINGINAGTNNPVFITSSLQNGALVTLTMTSNITPCPAGNPATSNTIAMIVNPNPTVNAGGAIAAICQGGTTSGLGGSVGGGATGGTWSTPAGGTFNPNETTLNATWTPPAGYSGTATLTLTTSGGTCGTVNASKNVIVNPNPTADAGAAIADICQGGITTGLGGSVGGGATGGTWSSSAGGTFTPNATTLNATWTPPAAYSGTATLTLTTSGGLCGTTTASKQVLVHPGPTVSAGSPTAAICQNGTTAGLGGSVGGGATGGTWSTPAGGTFNPNETTLNATWTPPAGYSGTATLTLTTSGGVCGTVNASKNVIVNPNPTADAGAATANICQGGITTGLGGSIGGGATGGTWSSSAGGTFTPNATTLNATWTPPAAYSGTATLTLTTSGGLCGTTTASKQVLVNPGSTVSAGNPTAAICQGGTTTGLGGSVGGGAAGGTWSTPAGGTFSPGETDLNATWTPPAGYSGTATLTLTTTGGLCGTATANKTVIVNPAPTAIAGGAISAICQGGTTTGLGGSVGGGATGGVWSSSAGGTFNPDATNLNATWTPPSGYSGTATLTLTTSGGTCGTATDNKTVTVNPGPTVNAGGAIAAICQDATTAGLGGSVSGGATGGVWSSSAGGTFNPDATSLNATWSPPAGYSGTVTLTLTSTGGSCGIATDSKTVTVNPNAAISLTSAAATTTQEVCRQSAISNITYSVTGATTFTATGLPPGVTASISGGVITISGTPNNTIGATTTYNYTINTTGPCINTSASGSIKVFVGNPANWGGGIKITSGSSTSICPPATGLTYSIPAVANAQYYIWSLPSGFTIISGELTNSITVAVSAAATPGKNLNINVTAYNPCGNNTTSGDFKVDVDNFTGVTATPATQSVCTGGSVIVVGTLTGNASSATWSAPSGSFSNIINNYISTPKTVTATYTPSITNGTVNLTITTNAPTGCSTTPGTAQVTVTVNEPAVITTQPVASQTMCSGSTATFSVVATGTGLTYQWRKNGVNITGATSSTLTLNNVITTDAGDYTVVVSGVSPCTPVTSTISTLVVNPRPTAALSGTTAICNGGMATLNLAVTGPGTISGTLSDGTTFSGTAPSINVNVSPAATTTYSVATLTNGTCDAIAADLTGTATVSVNNRPTATLSGTPTICNGETTTLTLAVTGTGTISGTLSDDTPFSGTAPTITVNVSPTTTTGYTISTLTNGTCSAIAADMTGNATVTVNPRPTAVLSGISTICNGETASLSLAVTGTGTITGTLSDGTVFSGTAPAIAVNVNPAVTTNYTITTLTDDVCTAIAADMTGTAAVTVNQRPTAVLSGTQGICDGSTATLSLAVTGSGIISGALSDGTPFSGNAPTISVNVSPSATTSYTISTLQDVNCTALASDWSGSATVSVDPRPTADISGTPVICNGETATLTVAVTGTGTISGTLSDGTAFIGTAPTISVNVSPSVTTSYTISTLTNGTCPVISADMTGTSTVMVNPRPTAILSGTQAICNGSTAALSLAVTGSGTISGTLSDGTAFSGTSPIINVNVTPTATTTYTISTLTDGTCASIAADIIGSAVVTVNEPVVITAQPATPQIVCASFPASFSVSASGTGLTYEWFKDNVSTGITTTDLNITQATVSDAGTYYVVVSGGTGCGPVQSENAVLVVNEDIIITNQPAPQTICEETTVSLTVAATGDIIDYVWRKNGIPIIDDLRVSGSRTATITITDVDINDSGNYDVVISGPGAVCGQSVSNPALLTVNPVPTVTATPASTLIYSGNTAEIALSGDLPGTDFNWTVVSTDITGADAGSGPSISQVLQTTGMVTGTAVYTITPTLNGCEGDPVSVTITVNPAPNVVANPESDIICSGNAPYIELSSDATGAEFNWTVVFTDASGEATGNGSIINQVLTATGFVNGTAVYTVTPSVSGINGEPITVTVTIKPKPNVIATPANPTVCSGNEVTINLTSDVANPSFTWTATGINASGASDGDGPQIKQTLTADGNSPGTVTYTVIPTADECIGDPFDVVVTVNPVPDVIATVTDNNICSSETTEITLTGNVDGTTFNWEVEQNGVTGALPQTNGSLYEIAQLLTNTGNALGTVTYTITPFANGCEGGPITIVITVNPLPQFTAIPVSEFICSGDETEINLESDVEDITFNWTVISRNNATGGESGTGSPGSTIEDELTATGTSPGTVSYSITATANECESAPP